MSLALENEFIDGHVRLQQMVGDCPPGVGAIRAELSGQFWQPREHGILLLIVAEFAGGEIVDLLGIRPSEQHIVYVRTGIAAVAGEENLRAARFLGEPILVHASMWEYIRSGMSGCFLFDADYARLIGLSRIEVDNADFGERIYKAHRAPPPHLPEIYVRVP